MKTEQELFEDIERAVERVIGKRTLSRSTYFRKDLEVDSIDFVDLSYELERMTGLCVRFSNWTLTSNDTRAGGIDLSVQQIIDHMMAAAKIG